MGVVIGIDLGGSRTKIIAADGTVMLEPMLVKAADPVTSMFGAFGKYVDAHKLKLNEIERIMVTGVGSSYIDKPIYGLPTGRVDEFLCNGLGGLYLTGLKKAVIVSMGTGTALVRAKSDGLGLGRALDAAVEYLGGTGIGGGTISGLSGKLLNMRDISLIIEAAESGDLNNIDLSVGDIARYSMPSLPPSTTASNFGKVSELASRGDIALGIINLVFQTIGTTAAFAVKNTDITDVVLIGRLTTIPQCAQIFKGLADLYKINFIIPENSAFGTAVGAIIAFLNGCGYVEL